MEQLFFYFSLSVCLSVCERVCLCVCLWTKFQSNECTNLDAVFTRGLFIALARTLLKLVTLGWRSRALWQKIQRPLTLSGDLDLSECFLLTSLPLSKSKKKKIEHTATFVIRKAGSDHQLSHKEVIFKINPQPSVRPEIRVLWTCACVVYSGRSSSSIDRLRDIGEIKVVGAALFYGFEESQVLLKN